MKIRSRPAPSIRAASSSSRGIWSKNFLSTNTIGEWITCGRISAQYVSIRFSDCICWNSGMMRTGGGMMMDATITPISILLPRKSIREMA